MMGCQAAAPIEEQERATTARAETADAEGHRPKRAHSVNGSDEEEVTDLESLDSVNTNDVDELLSHSIDEPDKDPQNHFG